MPRVVVIVHQETPKRYWNGEVRGGLVFTSDIFQAKHFSPSEINGVVEDLSPEIVRIQHWQFTTERGETTAVALTDPQYGA